MKSQPNSNYVSNDVVMTPDDLAQRIVDHFDIWPHDIVLEPCCGEGAFLRALEKNSIATEWCEIEKGRDFLGTPTNSYCYDWIITNPPWSKIRPFLVRSMEVANNVVFLFTINHLWTKARLRLIKDAGFRIEEIVLVPYPKEWPSSGFQLGVIHLKKGLTTGQIKFSELK